MNEQENDPQPPNLSVPDLNLEEGVISSSSVPAAPQFRMVRELCTTPPQELEDPAAVVVDPEGRILILDRRADVFRLMRLNAAGDAFEVTADIGRGSNDGELQNPVSLAVGAGGHVYVADEQAGKVSRFSADGRWQESLEADDAGNPFDSPRDVQLAGDARVLIADSYNNRIVVLPPSDSEDLCGIIDEFDPTNPDDEDDLYEPHSVCTGPDGRVFVADTNNNRVLVFDAEHQLIGCLEEPGMFEFPVRVRPLADGSFVVADRRNQRVRRFDSANNCTGLILLARSTNGPGGDVAVSAGGEVVMVNTVRRSIMVVDFIEPNSSS